MFGPIGWAETINSISDRVPVGATGYLRRSCRVKIADFIRIGRLHGADLAFPAAQYRLASQKIRRRNVLG